MAAKIKDKRIKLSQIRPSPHGFRRSTSQQRIEELADSIDKIGQLNQLTVRPMGKGGRYYELLAGHRRYLALKELGEDTARCAVLTTDDDRAVLASVMENLQQQQLSGDERKRAEAILTEFYTKLYTEEEEAEPEEETPAPRAKKRTTNDVLKRGGGRKKTVKSKVAEAVSKDLNISTKTYLRDVKRAENLIPSADKALEIKRITKEQANLLADMEPAEQRKRLPIFIRENQEAREKEEKRAAEEKKSGPTAVARRMLEAILFECKDLSVRVRDFMAYVDGKDLDYKVLRKAGLELATEQAQLLTGMVSFVEGD